MSFAPIILCALISAQDLTIRTQVPLVVAPTTVTDRKGHIIDGLSESDFVVLDNGRVQNARMDTTDIALLPISLVVAVQTNDLSTAAVAKIRKVGSLLEPLVTGERGAVAIISFADEINTVLDFSGSNDAISRAFRSLKADGDGARSVDAIARAIELLHARPPSHRRIVLLISESRDRGSSAKLPAVLQAAQRDNVIVYPLTFSVHATPWTARPEDAPPTGGGGILAVVTELARLGKINTAEELARFTGGRRLSFLTLHALETGISRFGEELHSQYLLSFSPSDRGGGDYHVLDVRVKGRPDLTIQTRPGYWTVE